MLTSEQSYEQFISDYPEDNKTTKKSFQKLQDRH